MSELLESPTLALFKLPAITPDSPASTTPHHPAKHSLASPHLTSAQLLPVHPSIPTHQDVCKLIDFHRRPVPSCILRPIRNPPIHQHATRTSSISSSLPIPPPHPIVPHAPTRCPVLFHFFPHTTNPTNSLHTSTTEAAPDHVQGYLRTLRARPPPQHARVGRYQEEEGDADVEQEVRTLARALAEDVVCGVE